ncbi:hypothetical protein [Chitinophaga sp. 212800010-3]|uniref:hypothetical protein n=1 Tax=unclassified Chitinophaga TaxID=2619133 RepID=UPI002DF505D0|nr:hypothetical protein [Chitinophaga sp. 212800010-3]
MIFRTPFPQLMYFIIPFIFLGCGPSKDPKDNAIRSVKKSLIPYKLMGPGIPRYDDAPTYIVCIKEYSYGPGLVDTIKSLINDFAIERETKKFSLDVYDDTAVANTVIHTIVNQQRLYTKKEGLEMNKHWVASYCGELMHNGKAETLSGFKHELSFFPDIKHAVKTGPKVALQQDMEYEPLND